MLETVTLNLVAAGLAKGASGGSTQIKNLLRERRFSAEIDGLATEFNSCLRDAVTTTVENEPNLERITRAQLREDWEDIAKELDQVDVVFEDEADAVLCITEAILDGAGVDLPENSSGRRSLERAVTDAYQDAITEFTERIAGTELADVLATEADIHLQGTVSRLEKRLSALETDLNRGWENELRNEGFVRLNSLYFQRHEPEPPERCWRAGFELVEVAAGYTIPREGVREDGSRYRVGAALIDDLANGNDCVLLGPPGSGKSTICNRVACTWHEERRGTVFYRESGQSKPFTDPDVFVGHVREADGHVLVVVEDAIREEAMNIFRVIKDLRHNDDVSFLLDARTREWHDSDTTLLDPRLQELKDSALVHHAVPRFDERECERVINRFETTTDAQVREDPNVLFDEIANESGIGAVLQLSYHLSVYADNTEETTTEGIDHVTSLEKKVQNTVSSHRERTVDGPGSADLPLQVGILINLLNAADIGVYPGLLHSVATTADEHRTIGRILDRFDGDIVFSNDEVSAADMVTPLRTNHEFWSTLYLQEVLSQLGERRAVELFEQCVDQLFGLFDDPQKRSEINRWFRTEMSYIQDIEATPSETSHSLVERIFTLGRRRPALAPLFGRTEFSTISLPSACPEKTAVRIALWRGISYYKSGDLDIAETEFETAIQRIDDTDEIEVKKAKELQAWCRSYLGILVGYDGEREESREILRDARDTFREVGEQSGEAHCLFYICKAYQREGKLDDAEQYLEQAHDIYREIGDQEREAYCLNIQGFFKYNRSEYDAAEEYLQESLELSREIGARYNEARTLNHQGLVSLSTGELNKAKAALHRGLKVAEQIGDKQGRAYIVHNLGDVALAEGNLSTAEQYFQESLDIEKEIGNPRGEAISYNYLGDVACKQGKLNEAEAYLEQGLELIRDAGDRRREAELLKTRGILAKNRGNIEDAEELLEESLGLYQAVGDREGEGDVLHELGGLARKRGDLEQAVDLYHRSKSIHEDIDNPKGVGECLGSLGIIAQRRGDYEAAEKRYRRSRNHMQELGDQGGEAYSLMLHGDLALERGDIDSATERYEASANLFSDIGDKRRQARVKRKQGEVARKVNDLKTAEQQYNESLSTFHDIGDRFGSARTLVEQARLAREKSSLDQSDRLFQEAIDQYRSIGATQQALEHLDELVELRQQRGEEVSDLHALADTIRSEQQEEV